MKLEKFDLEKALNGAKVVTRDGREVTELSKFTSVSNYPLVGVLGGWISNWTIDGMFREDIKESDADLFLAVEPKSIYKIYKNVYRSIDGGIELGSSFLTREQAITYITDNETYIKTIEITDEPE